MRADGTLTALDASGTTVWAVPALGLPSTAGTVGKSPPGPAELLVPADGAFVRRDRATGAELGRSAATGLPDGGIATSVGPVVVLRLPDRVQTYR